MKPVSNSTIASTFSVPTNRYARALGGTEVELLFQDEVWRRCKEEYVDAVWIRGQLYFRSLLLLKVPFIV